MASEKKIYCPRCDSSHTDLISFVYRCLQSGHAGQKLFTAGVETEFQKKRMFSEKKKAELLNALKPPAESKLSVPALTVALMAFFLSWLVVGSLLMSKIGGTTYLVITTLIILVIAYPFYSTLKFMISQIRTKYVKYRQEKSVWIKKRYCYDCEHIFTIK
jgi:hypothetical protein